MTVFVVIICENLSASSEGRNATEPHIDDLRPVARDSVGHITGHYIWPCKLHFRHHKLGDDPC